VINTRGAEAVRLGLACAPVPDHELENYVNDLAQQIARTPMQRRVVVIQAGEFVVRSSLHFRRMHIRARSITLSSTRSAIGTLSVRNRNKPTAEG
jgi:enoyl-CoA hydratase/carnithine racemase